MWFTRSTGGNIARISPTGAIMATSKVAKGSEPLDRRTSDSCGYSFTTRAAYPAVWHQAYGVLELCMHKTREGAYV
jgi:hypothetical protein